MTTTSHPYAQQMRWMADGLDMQTICPQHGWRDIGPAELMRMIADDAAPPPGHFRLAPRTMFLAGTEVELPVTAPEDGQMLWHCNALGECRGDRWREGASRILEQLRARGRLFASQHAALAVDRALQGLLDAVRHAE